MNESVTSKKAKSQAFVLMPFGDDWDEIFRELISAPLLGAGYSVARADTFLTQRNVLRDIVRGIYDADLVVAEITTPNPNVFYELGLAQGLGIPTVLLAQDLLEVPFDLRSYRIEHYSTNFAEVESFRERLKSIGLEHIAGRVEFGSPVSDFARDPRQLIASEEEKKVDQAVASRVADLDDRDNESELEPAGFLDHVILLEESTGGLEALFLEVTSDLTKLSDAADEKTLQMTQLANNEAPNPREVFRLTTAIANDLTAFSQSVNRRLPEMEARTQEMISAGAGVTQWIASGVTENGEQVAEFRDSMVDFAQVASIAIRQMDEMRDSTRTVRGASRELDRASGRVEDSLGKLIDIMTQIEAFALKASDLASEALDESGRTEITE